MPILHLLRHAKSSARKGIEDFERPLTRRGLEAARRIGSSLAARERRLDLVLCSPARRTRQTMEGVLAAFGGKPRFLCESELYLADCERLLDRLCRLGEGEESVLLIAHNPGLRDLALLLAEASSPSFAALLSGKFPTAASASFRVETAWPDLGSRRHPLLVYETPKSLGRP